MVGLPGQTLRDLAGDVMFFRDLGADMIGMVRERGEGQGGRGAAMAAAAAWACRRGRGAGSRGSSGSSGAAALLGERAAELRTLSNSQATLLILHCTPPYAPARLPASQGPYITEAGTPVADMWAAQVRCWLGPHTGESVLVGRQRPGLRLLLLPAAVSQTAARTTGVCVFPTHSLRAWTRAPT